MRDIDQIIEAGRDELDRSTDEPIYGVALLGTWARRHLARVLADRDRLAARVRDLEAGRQRVADLAHSSDDGSEYEHDHGLVGGHDQCPACWAEGIRNALQGSNHA